MVSVEICPNCNRDIQRTGVHHREVKAAVSPVFSVPVNVSLIWVSSLRRGRGQAPAASPGSQTSQIHKTGGAQTRHRTVLPKAKIGQASLEQGAYQPTAVPGG